LLAAAQSDCHPHCFDCSQSNPFGLAVQHQVRPDGGVSAGFIGHCALEGYPGWLHGGLIATLLDGAMTHCLFARGLRAATAELRVRYHAPVLAAEFLEVSAWLEESGHGLHRLRAEIVQDRSRKVAATAKFIELHE
jgi:acyl-coenzyme A thioesterase PaaI-like protein